MACKKNPAERMVALALLWRLHRILQVQEEQGAKLSNVMKKVLSRAIYTTFLDLNDLGHKRVAFWYLRRKPKTIIFLRRKREKEVLREFEELARAYIAEQHLVRSGDAAPDMPVVSSYAVLEDCFKKAVRLGLKNEAMGILRRLGFSPKTYLPKL